MKRYAFVLICGLLACYGLRAQDTVPASELSPSTPIAAQAEPKDPKLIWDEANTAYINGNYREAITLYRSIEEADQVSSKLYYNLGNAYFKDGKMGPAILYYNKALKLAPNDADIRYNLAVANNYTKDRIETIPQFPLKRWMVSLCNALSSNAWAVLSLVFFVVTLAGTIAYLLGRRMWLRKTGFYNAILFCVLFVISVTFAVSQRNDFLHPDDAIVMAGSVSVKSSPDANSRDIFILHEGTKVQVEGELGNWREISIADGKKGWMEADAIEMIR